MPGASRQRRASTPIGIAGTTVVPFFGFTFPGSPNVVDPTSLIGIQWQMDTPVGVACNASFSTGPTFVFAGNFVNADALASGAWVPIELDLGAVTEPGFDPSQIVQVGVQFFSGSPDGIAFPPPASVVFEIDTVTD